MSSNTKSPFFALIIGINNYQRIRELRGAIADAEDVEMYITEKLGVSEGHIRKLYDSAATREAIIGGFRDLKEDFRIQKDDPILIYFAGHGSETKAPDGWHAEGGKIQLIVPQDTGTTLAGKIVNPIADRTIAVLLEDLAKVKGNNIVRPGCRGLSEDLALNMSCFRLLSWTVATQLPDHGMMTAPSASRSSRAVFRQNWTAILSHPATTSAVHSWIPTFPTTVFVPTSCWLLVPLKRAPGRPKDVENSQPL